MTTFNIPEMSCGHCKATVEKAVKGLDAGATLSFDMEARKVSIQSKAANEAIFAALSAAGYEATAA